MDTDLATPAEEEDASKGTDQWPNLDPSALMDQARRERRTRTLNALSPLLALLIAAVPAYESYRQARNQVPKYEAQIDVLYQIERASFGEADTIMANALILAERRGLIEDVALASGTDVEELVDNSSVDLVEGASGTRSTVLRFRVRSIDPDDALVLVQGWVGDYLDDVIVGDPDSARREELEATIADLQQRRLEAREAIVRAEQAKAATPLEELSTVRRAQLTVELDRDVGAAGSRYDEIVRDINTQVALLAQLDPVGPSVAVEALGDGHVGDEPVSPKPLRSLALGLATGLVLAATYLFVMSYLRSR